MKENISDLKDDVEYLIIQNEETGEEIVKITSQTSFIKEPYIIRTKYKQKKRLIGEILVEMESKSN